MSTKAMIRAALIAGKTNAEVLAHVRKEHPYSKMSLPTINYYRNKLRREFPQIRSDRDARRRRG